MAAQLSSTEEKRPDLVTRDFLGGGGGGSGGGGRTATGLTTSSDLDLSLEVASAGWQNQLELLKLGPGLLNRGVQELNLLQHDSSSRLDLKVVGPTASANPFASEYASVCTLEKVKSALERAGRESRGKQQPPSPSSSSSSITSSSSIKRRSEGEDDGMDGCDSSAGGMMAAGCPRCLMYVLIDKRRPRCPRCDSHVSLPVLQKKDSHVSPPVLQKKARLDLNFTLHC